MFIRSGGSIPIVGDFQNVLKLPTLMMGFGLPDDNLHAPNEKFHSENFYRGTESIVRLLEVVGGCCGVRHCRLQISDCRSCDAGSIATHP